MQRRSNNKERLVFYIKSNVPPKELDKSTCSKELKQPISTVFLLKTSAAPREPLLARSPVWGFSSRSDFKHNWCFHGILCPTVTPRLTNQPFPAHSASVLRNCMPIECAAHLYQHLTTSTRGRVNWCSLVVESAPIPTFLECVKSEENVTLVNYSFMYLS